MSISMSSSSTTKSKKEAMVKACLWFWYFIPQIISTVYESYFFYMVCWWSTHSSVPFYVSIAAMLFADPQDVTVEVNEWAQFNCIFHCGYVVSWYMAGHSIAIRRNNTVPGLLIKRPRVSTCTESNGRTHFFEVLATEAFNKSTFYCAAFERHQVSCSCGTGGRCYSRPALLTGKFV